LADNIFVRPEFWRLGAGKALLERAHALAASHGVGQVELNVYEFNRAAVALYEQLRYATVRRRMRCRLDDVLPPSIGYSSLV